MNAPTANELRIIQSIRLVGDVQGFGVRPAVASLARQFGLFGTVKNCLQGVDIVASGSIDAIDAFRDTLGRRFANTRQVIRSGKIARAFNDFRILESEIDGALKTVIPRDRVICDECLQECLTPGDRRFGYLLNGCAQCGPRYSILQGMPYDRSRTGMARFTMCDACRAEYDDPTHRRCHAQTNACPNCGPKVWYEDARRKIQTSRAALEAAVDMIHHGGILAMKGLGGYQLVCDARQETVVRMLRERKHRPAKPLAVMVASMAAAKELAEIDIDESNALSDVAGPIVLLRCKDQSALASSVHPGLRDVGIMLPTTTMHHLLLRRLRMPLIVTSGNMEGEPLEYDERSATARLSELADGFLHHNRPIVNPIDDSVVRIVGGRRMTIRAARGLAPCSFDLVAESSILAVGGLQKSAIAVSNGRTAMLGPHVGDLVSVRTRKRFAEHQESICRLIGSRTPTLALDAHPDTADSLHRKSTNDSASKCIQHHHAHVVAGMVEAGWLERTVLGVAFDGMGYGSDGTLWGGEFLIVSRKTFQRVGRLRPFSLLGGDVAVLQPWRIAVALLADAFGEEATLELVDQSMISCLRIDRSLATNAVRLMQRSSLSSITSSVGRLFDGVAALVCGLGKVGYEGEAAMRFEALIEGDDELRSNSTTAARRVYSFSLIQGILLEVDWRPMIREIVADLRAEVSEKNISLKFHRTIAAIVADVRERFSDLPMVLAGGVFQNRIFVESITEQLHRRSAEFFLPGDVPVNDGGLALGQLAVASSIEEVVCA